MEKAQASGYKTIQLAFLQSIMLFCTTSAKIFPAYDHEVFEIVSTDIEAFSNFPQAKDIFVHLY